MKAINGGIEITGGLAEHPDNQYWGDGIRLQGSGSVSTEAKYTHISSQSDAGLYIHSDTVDENASITITAIGTDHEGEGNGNVIFGKQHGVQSDAGGENVKLDVIAQTGNNVISAEEKNAVFNEGVGSITIRSGHKNIISGGQNAVQNSGSGTITIQAGANAISGISLLANYEDYDNFLTAGDNGVASDGTGITNVIADNNNYIYGVENGILSSDSGSINVTAGNDNTIGQIDSEISKNGINITAGTVSLTANNTNNIFATNNGILASGDDGKTVNIEGKNNSLTVGRENISYDAAGIYFSNSTNANVNVNNGIDEDSNPIYAEKFDINVESANDAMGIKFDGSSKNNVNVFADSISIDASSTSGRANAIWLQSTTSDNTIHLNASDSVYLHANTGKYASGAVIWFTGNNNKLSITGGNNTVTSEQSKLSMQGIYVGGSNNDINIKALSGDNSIYSQSNGLDWSDSNGSFDLISEHGSNFITSTNSNAVSIQNIDNLLMQAAGTNNLQAGSDGILFTTVTSSGSVKLLAGNNIINAGGDGIYLTKGTKGTVELEATNGNNEITADKNNGIAVYSSSVTLKAENGKNIIRSNNPFLKWDSAIYAVNQGSQVILTAQQNEIFAGQYGIISGSNKDGGIVSLTATAGDNIISSNAVGIRSAYNGKVTLTSNQNNRITSTSPIDYAVYAYNSANIELNSTNNIVEAGDNLEDSIYGNSYAIAASANASISVVASESNQISGLVYGEDGSLTTISGQSNIVYSSSMVDGAGDLDKDTTEGEASFKDKTVISALYAEGGAEITLSGKSNRLYTIADPNNHDYLERVVWAYNGNEGNATNISIDGYTDISTNQYDESLNSIDIAIAAGTAVNLNETLVSQSKNTVVEDRAQVLVDYADLTDESGNTLAKSAITGDILAAYEGYVDIKPIADSNAGINITAYIEQ